MLDEADVIELALSRSRFLDLEINEVRKSPLFPPSRLGIYDHESIISLLIRASEYRDVVDVRIDGELKRLERVRIGRPTLKCAYYNALQQYMISRMRPDIMDDIGLREYQRLLACVNRSEVIRSGMHMVIYDPYLYTDMDEFRVVEVHHICTVISKSILRGDTNDYEFLADIPMQLRVRLHYVFLSPMYDDVVSNLEAHSLTWYDFIPDTLLVNEHTMDAQSLYNIVLQILGSIYCETSIVVKCAIDKRDVIAGRLSAADDMLSYDELEHRFWMAIGNGDKSAMLMRSVIVDNITAFEFDDHTTYNDLSIDELFVLLQDYIDSASKKDIIRALVVLGQR
jgi:hypothetical protein